MTSNEELLRRLRGANPIVSAGRIATEYEEELLLLDEAVRRRQPMDTQTRPEVARTHDATTPPDSDRTTTRLQPWTAVAAAVTAAAAVFAAIVGAVVLFGGSTDDTNTPVAAEPAAPATTIVDSIETPVGKEPPPPAVDAGVLAADAAAGTVEDFLARLGAGNTSGAAALLADSTVGMELMPGLDLDWYPAADADGAAYLAFIAGVMDDITISGCTVETVEPVFLVTHRVNCTAHFDGPLQELLGVGAIDGAITFKLAGNEIVGIFGPSSFEMDQAMAGYLKWAMNLRPGGAGEWLSGKGLPALGADSAAAHLNLATEYAAIGS